MSMEELLKKLNQEYLASVPQKISQLQALCAQSDVSALSDAFHKLKGTGRTYGLPEISQLAEVVEKICLERPEQAVTVAHTALGLLNDVYLSRRQGLAFSLDADPRFAEVCNALKH